MSQIYANLNVHYWVGHGGEWVEPHVLSQMIKEVSPYCDGIIFFSQQKHNATGGVFDNSWPWVKMFERMRTG